MQLGNWLKLGVLVAICLIPLFTIPPWPPDLNCGDISYRNFYVLPDDPHGFDGDKDGIGCEG